MEVKDGRKVRNNRNAMVRTIVRGVRGDCEIWEMCDLVAKQLCMTRNELVLLAIYEYCKGRVKDGKNEE